MPNYCKGQLKIRGEFENILRFVNDNIRTYDYLRGTDAEPVPDLSKRKIHRHGNELTIQLDSCAYIEGTHRNFIEKGIYDAVGKANGTAVLVVDLFAAWDIEAEPYKAFSKKYSLEFRTFAFERGMQFNRDIWISGGQEVRDETIKFGDYDWECIAPRIGG